MSSSATSRLFLFQTSSNKRRTTFLFSSDMVFSFLTNSRFLLACCESRLSGLTWDRWRLGCAGLYVGQGSGSASGNKKEPNRFCSLSARCGAWPSKKLRSDYEAGVSSQTAKSRHDLVLQVCVCQGESKTSSVQKEQRRYGHGVPMSVECGVISKVSSR